MLTIINLTVRQVKTIYKKRMVKDFPFNERKPLRMIIRALRRQRYICLGLVDQPEGHIGTIRNTEEDVLGYAFFVKIDDNYLFDYLAIREDVRNHNHGSEFLKLIKQRFADANIVIGEVEDPNYAKNDSQRELQRRRYDFYLRNKVIDTGVKAYAFGVNFLLLELDVSGAHNAEEIEQLYLDLYRIMLPKRMFEKNIYINYNK